MGLNYIAKYGHFSVLRMCLDILNGFKYFFILTETFHKLDVLLIKHILDLEIKSSDM